MRKTALLLGVALLACTLLFAQKKSKKAPAEISTGPADSAWYTTTRYRLIGPFRGGRSAAVTGSFKNRNTFYFGSTGGGVWKTTDGGDNWKNISDKYFGGSIGAVAVAPSDETILYAGEGENSLRGNVSEGLGGLWRSDDGGRSWRNLGLRDGRHIIRILIHPKNPDIAWVAVMGHLFGPHAERGVFKTVDGGKTWKKTLYVNDQTGCSDLVMEPGNPSVFYAGMWHVRRTPYSMESGGEGSGLYKSVDGGETWTNLTEHKGLPKGIWGIVGVAVMPGNTDHLLALIENAAGGLFQSTDGGLSWNLLTENRNIRQRAWYYDKVFVDPKNENLVYVLNVNFMRSTDGGKTFSEINTPHGDHHDLWIDPEDGNRMIIADDGGAQVSFDGGVHWSPVNNQPTAQIYRVTTDNAFPYRILGAQQDNSTIRIKSRTYGAGITEADWSSTAGFESGYVVADPQNPDIVYGGNYDGFLGRLDHKTGENRVINVWPDNPTGAGAAVQKYRFQWNFPIFFSPHNPKRLYAAGNHLFVTENEGQSWEMISPDLTTDDKIKQAPSGGPITKDNTSVEYYCTIFTATESPLEKDLLWAGSDDGLIHISRDGGKNWENVTPPAAGKFMMWNCVETDPFKKGAAYFVGTKYKMDDFTPYIFHTEDYGRTWTEITNGIGRMHFTRCLRADRKRPGLLYTGTEYGMYISYDYGMHWNPFQLNLPVVPVTDMTIKENDLVIATQGRAFWILDDLSLLQQKPAEMPAANLKVFDVNDAYLMEGASYPDIRNGGVNPPNGVVFNYYLKSAGDSTQLLVRIYDKQHRLIRTYDKQEKEISNRPQAVAGMNRFVWDMEYPRALKIEGMILWNGSVDGPKAAPGKYTAHFVLGSDSLEVPFTIKGDPNFTMTEAQYDEQVGFLLEIRDKFSAVQKAILDIRSLRGQIEGLISKLDSNQSKHIKPMGDSLYHQLTTIEEALYQTKAKSGQDVLNYPIRINDRISAVYRVASSGYHPPTRQVREAFDGLRIQADAQLDKLKKIMAGDVKDFNKMIHDNQIPVIGVKD